LQRKPDEWRNLQTEKKKLSDRKVEDSVSPTPKESLTLEWSSVAEPTPSQPKKKRKRQEDEIDALFNSFSGKKKRGAVDSKPTNNNLDSQRRFVSADEDLQKILSAIQAAPRGEKSERKQRKNS